ncbi:ATP-binding protein [Streptomyces sp. NPDC020096]
MTRLQRLRRQQVTLPALPRAVPLARITAQVLYTQWGLRAGDRILDASLLILSELATNSVRHAAEVSPVLTVTYAVGADVLAFAVHDRHPFHPLREGVAADPCAGDGLVMVMELTHELGGTLTVRPDPDQVGKSVWITLPL